MGLPEHLTSGAIGIALWEAVKHVTGAAIKRRTERAESKKKVLREDVGSAAAKVSACLDLAIEYYTTECSPARRIELATGIRHTTQTLAHLINGVNVGLRETGEIALASGLLISFRKATSLQLDVAGLQPVSADDPAVAAMYRAGMRLLAALTELKYQAT